jgi:hypothetical protein
VHFVRRVAEEAPENFTLDAARDVAEGIGTADTISRKTTVTRRRVLAHQALQLLVHLHGRERIPLAAIARAVGRRMFDRECRLHN